MSHVSPTYHSAKSGFINALFVLSFKAVLDILKHFTEDLFIFFVWHTKNIPCLSVMCLINQHALLFYIFSSNRRHHQAVSTFQRLKFLLRKETNISLNFLLL